MKTGISGLHHYNRFLSLGGAGAGVTHPVFGGFWEGSWGSGFPSKGEGPQTTPRAQHKAPLLSLTARSPVKGPSESCEIYTLMCVGSRA